MPELTEEQSNRLRSMRLYHWRERGHWRRVEAQSKDPKFKTTCGEYAEWHMMAVETLNAFFTEYGDTAERDDERARA